MITNPAYIIVVSLFLAPFTQAQSRWSFELHGGIVHNIDLPLVIKQKGYPDIRIEKADFYSEPLNDPPYWDWRFTKWFNNKSIEFEAIHHKLYLKNRPPEVEWFGISHGYNMLMFNHGRQLKHIIVRAGMGSVLVHPESTIRGMEYPTGPGFDIMGYRLRGVVLNLATAKQFKFGKYFFLNAEAKVTASMIARSPIVNGYARVHNIAFQLILGPGVNWAVKNDINN